MTDSNALSTSTNPRAATLPKPKPVRPVTLDDLAKHDRDVDIAIRRRHVSWLRVSGAHIPDVPVFTPHPGVPPGAEFLPVEPNPELVGPFFLGDASWRGPYAKGGEFGEVA